jgi:DNA-binding transcriptional regulator PaaX
MKNSEKDSLVRSVYNIIRNRKGKVTAKHIEKEIGSKYKVRYALIRLIKEGKIRRTRALE